MKPTDEIAALWFARYEREGTAFAEVLRSDPFQEWERDAMPEMGVDQELRGGLNIAYALGSGNTEAGAFFERAHAMAQRAIGEDKLTSPLCIDGFPLNRGRLYRSYGYARAVFGEPLDILALHQSSRDFEEWCKGYGKGEWDSQAQANYLAAVRLAVIAEDIDRARELLKTKKSFKWHKEEHALWKRLVEKTGEVESDEEFRASFATYFDKLRDPRFVPDVYMETDVLRLELAAIRDKYLVSNSGVIDWRRAIESIPGGYEKQPSTEQLSKRMPENDS